MATYKEKDGKLEITKTIVSKQVVDKKELEMEKEMLENDIINIEARIAEIDTMLSECTKLKLK
jgi:hypothetical protein